MAVTQPDYDSAPRGRTDAARHRHKIKEAIRQNLPDIISDEAIITRKKNAKIFYLKSVKITVICVICVLSNRTLALIYGITPTMFLHPGMEL